MTEGFSRKKKVLKKRLDLLIVERGLVESPQKALSLIMAGEVFVDGVRFEKAGEKINTDAVITVRQGPKFVGRGGVKLAGCLDGFGIDVTGLNAIDIGSSTGGFTDCLLQRGASKVYAIDVGKGLLDINLRQDPRVRVLEGRNIRYLDVAELGAQADMAVIDVSFISLKLVLPKVRELVKKGGLIFALVKPQFEAGRSKVGKGGVVKDPEVQKKAVEGIVEFSAGLGLKSLGEMESPITGAKGNKEFWIFLAAQVHCAFPFQTRRGITRK